MRFGVNTWVWTAPLTNEEFEEIAPKVKELGFDWIEIPLESPEDLDYERLAATIRELGLGVSTCAAMGPDRDLIHPDEAIRQSGMDYLKKCIDANKVLGATNLVGPLYSAVGRTWQQTEDERAKDMEVLVANLKELGEYAAQNGVTLCVEPLNRFETSFINLASQVVEVVDRVDHPNVQVMLDSFHMNIEEKSLGDAIRLVGPRLKHFHSCENDRGAPGSGNVDWDGVSAALKEIGYDGPVVIESFTSKVKSIAKAAAIWRSLAPSQDQLAADGLKFLKQQLN
jgi:D-psicose/D-tagatose/L-ribulose 3-epimerase